MSAITSHGLWPTEASAAYRELESLRMGELEEVFLRGTTPSLDTFVGWVFRGTNTPGWAKIAGIKKFMKGCWRDASGNVYGYNLPVVQNSLYEPWIAKSSDANPKRFGFYSVEAVNPESADNAHLHAVLLDYSKGGNPPWDPSCGLRDYVVQVDPSNPDLFLGKAYYALGPARVAWGVVLVGSSGRGCGWGARGAVSTARRGPARPRGLFRQRRRKLGLPQRPQHKLRNWILSIESRDCWPDNLKSTRGVSTASPSSRRFCRRNSAASPVSSRLSAVAFNSCS